MHHIFLGLVLTIPALALNITVDNVSPQIIYSPPPCYPNVTGCTFGWRIRKDTSAFNGSVTQATGARFSQGSILPRASLAFQGTDILFMPGMHSTARASVVVDDRASVLLNTTHSAFAGIGLDPVASHTITVMFIPSDGLTTLAIDYFQVTQPDGTIISTSTSSFFTTVLPTTLPSATTLPSITPSPTPVRSLSQATVPTGTIAAVSLSGAFVVVLGALAFFYAVRRQRRRDALRRERSILYDLHLPSEPHRSWREGLGDPFSSVEDKEKGKFRAPDLLSPPSPYYGEPELDWRVATPPPASLGKERSHSMEESSHGP